MPYAIMEAQIQVNKGSGDDWLVAWWLQARLPEPMLCGDY